MTQQEEQLFAVRWCLARAAAHFEKNTILASPAGHPLDLVVNGVNITRTILDVLDMIDPARTKAAVSGGWIPVTERLPDHTDIVIVCDADDVWFAYRNKMGVWFDPCSGCMPENITHWMELPEPPSNS